MVVSDIGEQWSPQTAPARQADIPMYRRSLDIGKMLTTIGMSIPKVPHDVPVANASRHATTSANRLIHSRQRDMILQFDEYIVVIYSILRIYTPRVRPPLPGRHTLV